MSILSNQIIDEIREVIREEINYLNSLEEEKVTHSLKPLSLKEAAIFLNVSTCTLYRYVNSAEFPYSRIGKQLYFFEEDLVSYLKHKRVKSKWEIASKVGEEFSGIKIVRR